MRTWKSNARNEGGKTVGNGNEIGHPSHYTSGDVECIDGIRAALGDEGFEAYCAGNAIKYVWRYRHKGGLTDIRKAVEYLGWLAEDLEHDERAEAERAQEMASAADEAAKYVYGAGLATGEATGALGNVTDNPAADANAAEKVVHGPWVAM